MSDDEINLKEFKLEPMKCELNYLSKSDGSAILSQGDTVALVSVNGPLDIKMQSQSIDKATLEVLFSTKGGKPSVTDRFKENVIKQTAEMALMGSLYPRTGVTITVQELEDYGGFLACSLNCSCLALLNAGLSMRYVYAAVCCALNEAGRVALNPKPETLQRARATFTFVFESRERALVSAFTEGTFSDEAYSEALQRCREASILVFEFYREIVRKYSHLIS